MVLQVVDAGGKVTHTGLLWPGDTLPARPVAPEPLQTPAAAQDESGGRQPWLGLAIGSAAAAGLAYGTAAFTAHRYRSDNSLELAQYEVLRTTTNSLVVVSAGLSAVAVGTGVAAVVRW